MSHLFFLLAGIFVGCNSNESMEPVFLQSAAEALTKDDLEAWRSKQLGLISSQIVAERQPFAVSSIEKEYEHRLLQLTSEPSSVASAPQLPAFLYLESARKCRNMGDLEEWRSRQITKIREVVPAEYQHFGFESIDREYEKHAAAFQGSASKADAFDLPMLMMNAEEFKTLPALSAWRKEQMVQIEKFVPELLRSFAYDSIEKEFNLRLEQMQLAEREPTAWAPGSRSNVLTISVVAFAALLSAIAFSVFATRRRGKPAAEEPYRLLVA